MIGTKDFVDSNKFRHPLVLHMLQTLLLPDVHVEYLSNYDFENWGPLEYAIPGDVCFDLRASVDWDYMQLPPQKNTPVPLGIRCSVPAPFGMKLHIRSGLAKHKNLCLANSVGIIDQGYRGEVTALIHNSSNEWVVISRGQKIVQASIELNPQANLIKVDELPSDETERGQGGFGHTGM